MPSKKITIEEKSIDKATMLKTVAAHLQTALPGLKEHFSEKKFEKRINKAAKILVNGIKQTPIKKDGPLIKKANTAKKKAEKTTSKDWHSKNI
jgi:hypothetical protein